MCIARVNASSHVDTWLISYVAMRLASGIYSTNAHVSRHVYAWLISYLRIIPQGHTYYISMRHVRSHDVCMTMQEWVMPQVYIYHVSMRYGTYKCEYVYIYIYITYMRDPWRLRAWVISHEWMCHVTRMYASRHMYVWVMSHA